MRKTFTERTRLIEDSIIKVRNDAFQKELIDRSLDPFSVRLKPFYDLSMVPKVFGFMLFKQRISSYMNFEFQLLGDRFKNQMCHAIDGLIFQPELDVSRGIFSNSFDHHFFYSFLSLTHLVVHHEFLNGKKTIPLIFD